MAEKVTEADQGVDHHFVAYVTLDFICLADNTANEAG